MSSIGIGGGGGPSSTGGGGISTGELLALVFEAGADLDGPLQQVGLQQLRDLQEAILSRGETLTQAEKEAFERGDKEEIKALLKRIAQKAQVGQARGQADQDRLGQAQVRTPQIRPPDRLPSGEALSAAEVLHLIYKGTPDQAQAAIAMVAQWNGEQLGELVRQLLAGGEKLQGAPANAAAVQAHLETILVRRQAHDKAFAPQKLEERAAGYAALRRQAALTDPKGLSELKRALMRLLSQAGLSPRDTVGRSGAAGALPLLQFMPASLHACARALGIHTLGDLLVHCRTTPLRALLGKALGLSPATLLLTAHRAELLDLPVGPGKKRPHLKDVLLLARLGANTIGGLATLHAVFERHPARLELLGDMVSALQKGAPQLVGRDRITRHELKSWASAAAKRGSDIQVGQSPAEGQHEVELAAERVLQWYLEQRWSNPEDAWSEVVKRLILLMQLHGVSLDEAAWNRLRVEEDEARVEEYRRIAQREATELDLVRQQQARELFEEYLWDEGDISLLTDLSPGQAPDASRQDRMICFWVDPAADPQHLMQGAGAAARGSVKTMYVCMDPDSGAVVPFGAG